MRKRSRLLRKRRSRLEGAERRKAYSGECGNCGIGYNLEYDHIVKFSHGGANTASNLQMLCRACNGRKEIRARASGLFGQVEVVTFFYEKKKFFFDLSPRLHIISATLSTEGITS